MTNRLARSNRGSGHSYTIDGVWAPGVTTILREGIPKPAFAEAAAKNVAGYALDHWEELEELTPSKRHAAMLKARWAERDAAAVRGTKVHALAAKIAGGAVVEVPEALVGLVDSYLAFATAYRVTEVAVEASVAYIGADPLGRDRYAGTVDLLAHLDDDPALWLIDWKTAASGVWPEVALQLAAYARADIIHIDGVEQPMPKVDRAAAVWLRSDGYDVYPLDIGPATFATFQYAAQVARFSTAAREAYVGEALPPRPLELEANAG